MARVSDDGQAVFLLHDRYRRFLIYNPKIAPEEDIFLTLRSNGPAAYTTSQFAHITLADRGKGVNRSWPPRLAYAPDKDKVLLGIPVGRDLWLLELNWNNRGRSPNRAWALKSSGKRLRLLSAQHVGNGPVYFITDGESISRVTAVGKRTLLGDITFDAFDYSPQQKVAIGFVAGRMSSSDGAILQASLGASGSKSFSVPGSAFDREWVFAFAISGQLYGSTDRVYKAVNGKWQPFGSDARLLAISASKKIWLVEDQSDQLWKVSF